MSTNLEYEQKISHFNLNDLLKLWENIKISNTPEWNSGKAFEYLLLRAFQLEGAEVRWPYSVTVDSQEIEQIDGIIYSDGLACLVESKDWKEPVNVEPIAKLRNQLFRRPTATIGVVFSRSGFTESTLKLARYTMPQNILLWNGEEIDYTLGRGKMRQALVAKYRYCIEFGLPDYDPRVEDLP
jgi:Restriction endonuclease